MGGGAVTGLVGAGAGAEGLDLVAAEVAGAAALARLHGLPALRPDGPVPVVRQSRSF
jgi:hypothetical protein